MSRKLSVTLIWYCVTRKLVTLIWHCVMIVCRFTNEQQKRKPKIQKRKNGDVKTVNQERSEVEEQNLAGEPQRKKRKKEKRKHK